MIEFEDDTIRKLVKDKFNFEYGFTKEYIEIFENFFAKRIPFEYLSHIRYALEFYGREKTKDDLFVISLEPEEHINVNPLKCIARIDPIRNNPNELNGLVIYYPKTGYSVKEVRTAIAHELAHAFFMIDYDKVKFNDRDKVENSILLENLCSLFGTIIMHDRSTFYDKKASRFVCRLEDIIKDMAQLHNKKLNKPNIS